MMVLEGMSLMEQTRSLRRQHHLLKKIAEIDIERVGKTNH